MARSLQQQKIAKERRENKVSVASIRTKIEEVRAYSSKEEQSMKEESRSGVVVFEQQISAVTNDLQIVNLKIAALNKHCDESAAAYFLTIDGKDAQIRRLKGTLEKSRQLSRAAKDEYETKLLQLTSKSDPDAVPHTNLLKQKVGQQAQEVAKLKRQLHEAQEQLGIRTTETNKGKNPSSKRARAAPGAKPRSKFIK